MVTQVLWVSLRELKTSFLKMERTDWHEVKETPASVLFVDPKLLWIRGMKEVL